MLTPVCVAALLFCALFFALRPAFAEAAGTEAGMEAADKHAEAADGIMEAGGTESAGMEAADKHAEAAAGNIEAAGTEAAGTKAAGTEAAGGRTVRVGYYENEVFQEGASPDAVKSGYAYEYYRKISEYTGWNYEYVYGGFNELYEMLIDGRIDLLAGLAYREDRAGLIGYPTAPMGRENYTLVRHDDDSTVTYSFSSVEGKKIGVLKSAVADILGDFLKERSIGAKIVLYDDYESLFSAFDSKEVDVLAAEGDGAYGRDHAEVIGTFGSSEYYLCVSGGREDLLTELDKAQSLLEVEEPDYISSLRSRYYSGSVSSATFSETERQWIDTHDRLRIGYLKNYLPYSDTAEDGEVTGIVKDIIPEIISELSITGIAVSYSGYDSYDDMISDMGQERIDLCFPVGGGLFYCEEQGIYQSTPVVSSSTDLVYHLEYDDEDIMHFAVNTNNRMQYYYIHSNFPDAQISFYPDIDSCLMAVLKGEVGATTLNGLRANEILKNSRYRGLYLKQLSKTDDRCFGIKIGNEGLLKVINHGIKYLGREYSQNIAYHYTDKLYSYTFSDLIRDNTGLFLSLLLFIALFIIIGVTRDLKRTHQANRFKTDFVSNMSHEIRTPITAILGMNDMIQRECRDENILQYSDNIGKAGESLMGIINDILDFSKIEAGHMELVEEPYSLAELLSEIHMMIRMRAEDKNLGFSMDVDENLPAMPVGDVQKLRQVIMNLLTNAVKYTERGEVRFTAKLVSRDTDSFIMDISVEDTGIGIKESEMDKLYSAFDRLDMERNRNIEGSGLGLAITRRLLSLMGSQIGVRSVYGEGSCFFFSLKQKIGDPAVIGTFEAKEKTSSHRGRAASFTAPDVRLLIADDTPMNLQVIRGLLKGNGLNIHTAQSGQECIGLFEKNEYDIVFLDQRMPNMDGVETLRALKKRFPAALKKTRIICLTANVLSGAREDMIRAGFDDYLTKPVSLPDMEGMIRKYISGERIIENIKEDDAHGQTDGSAEGEDGKSELSGVAGLDMDSGMAYCGDMDDYLFALETYAESINIKADRIEANLKEGDIENYAINVHSLKSTSGAIGANELKTMAAKLEAAANAGDRDTLCRETPELLSKYRALKAVIKDVLERSEVSGDNSR